MLTYQFYPLSKPVQPLICWVQKYKIRARFTMTLSKDRRMPGKEDQSNRLWFLFPPEYKQGRDRDRESSKVTENGYEHTD